MAEDDWKDPLIYSGQAKKQMEDDPELAEAMREIAASMRQAHAAWKAGQYASFEDAMEAITGQRPEPMEDDELSE